MAGISVCLAGTVVIATTAMIALANTSCRHRNAEASNAVMITNR